MQRLDHERWDNDDDDVAEDVEGGVGEPKGGQIDAMSTTTDVFIEGVFHWSALEDTCKDGARGEGDNDAHDNKTDSLKPWANENSKVQQQYADFRQADIDLVQDLGKEI